MSEVKSGFRRLLELTDKSAREELNSYYIISESRMDNYLNCLEDGAKQIAELRAQLAKAQGEIGFRDKWLNQWQLKAKEAIDRCNKAEAELAEERHENEQLIALRDEYEELVGNVALILGCTDEWSNCHDHRCCIVENATEITHKLAELRERLNKSWEREDKMSEDRKSTRLNSSHRSLSRMPSSA